MLYEQCFSNLGDPITAEGYVYEETNINMSSIYTKLIQEAGRFCDHYASDLLYSIDSVNKDLESHTQATHYFGFREMGVDHKTWVSSKDTKELKDYRSIWKLTLEFKEDNYYDFTVVATLQRVNYNTNAHYWAEIKEGGNRHA